MKKTLWIVGVLCLIVLCVLCAIVVCNLRNPYVRWYVFGDLLQPPGKYIHRFLATPNTTFYPINDPLFSVARGKRHELKALELVDGTELQLYLSNVPADGCYAIGIWLERIDDGTMRQEVLKPLFTTGEFPIKDVSLEINEDESVATAFILDGATLLFREVPLQHEVPVRYASAKVFGGRESVVEYVFEEFYIKDVLHARIGGFKLTRLEYVGTNWRVWLDDELNSRCVLERTAPGTWIEVFSAKKQ